LPRQLETADGKTINIPIQFFPSPRTRDVHTKITLRAPDGGILSFTLIAPASTAVGSQISSAMALSSMSSIAFSSVGTSPSSVASAPAPMSSLTASSIALSASSVGNNLPPVFSSTAQVSSASVSSAVIASSVNVSSSARSVLSSLESSSEVSASSELSASSESIASSEATTSSSASSAPVPFDITVDFLGVNAEATAVELQLSFTDTTVVDVVTLYINEVPQESNLAEALMGNKAVLSLPLQGLLSGENIIQIVAQDTFNQTETASFALLKGSAGDDLLAATDEYNLFLPVGQYDVLVGNAQTNIFVISAQNNAVDIQVTEGANNRLFILNGASPQDVSF
jgi:hypothetical protein